MLDRSPPRPPPAGDQLKSEPISRSSTRRQRAWRARQAHGEAIAPVPYDAAVVNFLIATRWLDPALADDRAEIGKAIGAMAKDAAKD